MLEYLNPTSIHILDRDIRLDPQCPDETFVWRYKIHLYSQADRSGDAIWYTTPAGVLKCISTDGTSSVASNVAAVKKKNQRHCVSALRVCPIGYYPTILPTHTNLPYSHTSNSSCCYLLLAPLKPTLATTTTTSLL